MSHALFRRRGVTALGVVGAAALLAACSPGSADSTEGGESTSAEGATSIGATQYPLTIDNCGEELEVEQEPESVLTIGTSAVALLDAAGASDRIVARAGEFGAELPAGLTAPPTDAEILDPYDPSIEVIVGAGADIIVGYGLFNAAVEDVESAGLANVVIDGECSHDAALTEKTDFEAIFDDVSRLAQVFDTQEQAEENLDGLRSSLEELTAAAGETQEGRNAAVVYYFSADATMSARGGQGIADDVLTRAGFDNVYGEEPSVYLEANIETLLDADPHTLVLAYGLYGESYEEALATFMTEPGVEDMAAVQADRIIGVPAADLAPDPGAVRGLEAVLEGTGALNQ
ncbi:ABC transporter substrate-binding protein [Ruania suaedae]|uniref:ABC transporter substrate-binding protein n=1 Tax=Ruania suaedae TaxID=2897774 RepID=UPI001E362264|nr:ABC transporter substrate-binding protein [Ruania suaedae]UFU01919.1 ABC transporter substrate-binding protein [Ruania suaedae]